MNKTVVETAERETTGQKEQITTMRVLCFSLGGESHCIDIRETRKVVKVVQVTNVPNTPSLITGVMNFCGEIIALVNLRYFLGLKEAVKTKETEAIITDIKGPPIGILVDKVEETLDIERTRIQPPLATLKDSLLSYTKGQVKLDQKILSLLNLEKIVDYTEKTIGKTGGEKNEIHFQKHKN